MSERNSNKKSGGKNREDNPGPAVIFGHDSEVQFSLLYRSCVAMNARRAGGKKTEQIGERASVATARDMGREQKKTQDGKKKKQGRHNCTWRSMRS